MYAKTEVDVTGRKHLVTNVLFTWVAQGAYLVAGFLMPRMIDHHLGKDMLGVWDFAWSLVGYFGLIQLGIIGSVNRFVARYRAEGNVAGVNRAVSSVTCILAMMATVVIALLLGLHWIVLPHYAAAKLGADSAQAHAVVLLLGTEIAIQTLFAGFGGVLTGCHCWKLNTMLQSGGYALSALGMMLALRLGGGLPSIAAVHLVGLIATYLAITYSAYKVCSGLRVRMSLASKSEAMKMLGFGTKSFVPQIGELLLNQTVNILIVSYLGPATLALYSRPRNLVATMRTLVMKMGGVLVSSSSAIEAGGGIKQVQSLAINTLRYTAYMTLPMAAVLGVLGGPILAVWMGPSYRNDLLTAILSIGTVVNLQVPSLAIVMGLNRHGPPGWIHLGGCLVTTFSVWVALSYFGCGLIGAAASATIPLALIYAFYIPAYTAKCLNIPLSIYLRDGLLGPILCNILLAIALLCARFAFQTNVLSAIAAGAVLGPLILIPMYWRWAVPQTLKARLIQTISKVIPRVYPAPNDISIE